MTMRVQRERTWEPQNPETPPGSRSPSPVSKRRKLNSKTVSEHAGNDTSKTVNLYLQQVLIGNEDSELNRKLTEVTKVMVMNTDLKQKKITQQWAEINYLESEIEKISKKHADELQKKDNKIFKLQADILKHKQSNQTIAELKKELKKSQREEQQATQKLSDFCHLSGHLSIVTKIATLVPYLLDKCEYCDEPIVLEEPKRHTRVKSGKVVPTQCLARYHDRCLTEHIAIPGGLCSKCGDELHTPEKPGWIYGVYKSRINVTVETAESDNLQARAKLRPLILSLPDNLQAFFITTDEESSLEEGTDQDTAPTTGDAVPDIESSSSSDKDEETDDESQNED